jgi:hypothetical protein
LLVAGGWVDLPQRDESEVKNMYAQVVEEKECVPVQTRWRRTLGCMRWKIQPRESGFDIISGLPSIFGCGVKKLKA